MYDQLTDILQRSLDQIEDNLRAELSAQELCRQVGFSLSHYYRIFEAATGMSVMRYITRRRLLHAAYAMSRGERATEAALNYGFDTHAGFYKAFRREFGCSPSAYLRSHRAARPMRVNLKEVTKMLDSRQISRALSAWGLEEAPVSNIYYANTGACSENTFLVGQQMYLRVSGRLGELHRLAALQKALLPYDLAAPIVTAKDGREIVTVDQTDFLLTRRLPGRAADALRLMAHPQEAAAIGEGLARLHQALRTCDAVLCQEEDLLRTLRDWAIPAAKQAMDLDGAFLNKYMERFSALCSTLPRQIIHRDPNPDNILLENGRVTGFVDFDLSRILPRIFDVAYAATGILCDSFTRLDRAQLPAFFEAAHALWQGYDRSARLTDEERRALPDMVIAIQLICVAAFSGSDKLAELARINQQMLRFLLENIEKLRF